MMLNFLRIVFSVMGLVVAATCALAQVPDDYAQLLTPKVDKFTQVRSPKPIEGIMNVAGGASIPAVTSAYRAPSGETFDVSVIRFPGDNDAYSLLTLSARNLGESNQRPLKLDREIGTVSFRSPNQVSFFKGTSLVHVMKAGKEFDKIDDAIVFARALAERIEKGEGDIPPLVKHLPDADNSQNTAVFFSKLQWPEKVLPNQPVLSALNPQGDADAVVAEVGSSKVLIIEFNTPQLATENDQRIIARIHELWNQGLPAPTAYRRVGNYSVLVFDAPDQQTANQLIDQVKYEQVVQWLGENPNILKEAQRRYVDTTLGVFIAVLKASGFALIGCLGAGGLIGALLFSRRRAQQKQVEAFSDAGGMLRLNLDELTPETNAARLLRDRN